MTRTSSVSVTGNWDPSIASRTWSCSHVLRPTATMRENVLYDCPVCLPRSCTGLALSVRGDREDLVQRPLHHEGSV
jgi:hypothetical protein